MGVITVFEVEHSQIVVGWRKMWREFDDGPVLFDGRCPVTMLFGRFGLHKQLLHLGRDFVVRLPGEDRIWRKKKQPQGQQLRSSRKPGCGPVHPHWGGDYSRCVSMRQFKIIADLDS